MEMNRAETEVVFDLMRRVLNESVHNNRMLMEVVREDKEYFIERVY